MGTRTFFHSVVVLFPFGFLFFKAKQLHLWLMLIAKETFVHIHVHCSHSFIHLCEWKHFASRQNRWLMFYCCTLVKWYTHSYTLNKRKQVLTVLHCFILCFCILICTHWWLLNQHAASRQKFNETNNFYLLIHLKWLKMNKIK